MIPAAFDYQRSATLDDALRAISGAKGTVKLLAGGQSLLPLLKLRLGSADLLVDIGRLAELKGVRPLPDGRLAIGAMTTYSELAESAARNYGLLRDALPTIGDVQVRNRGTVGGAIAHADPRLTWPPACWPSTPRSSPARSGASGRSRSTGSSRVRSRPGSRPTS